jgi:hypothetical protein
MRQSLLKSDIFFLTAAGLPAITRLAVCSACRFNNLRLSVCQVVCLSSWLVADVAIEFCVGVMPIFLRFNCHGPRT